MTFCSTSPEKNSMSAAGMRLLDRHDGHALLHGTNRDGRTTGTTANHAEIRL